MKQLSCLALKWISLIIALLIIWVIYATFKHYYIYTSDAYVDGNVIGITPEINGKVIAVNIKEGEHVKKGDILVKIDPTPYQLQLQQDMASLQTAKNNRLELIAQIHAANASKKAAWLNVQHTRATWQHMAGKARAAFSEQALKDAQYAYDSAEAQFQKATHDLIVLQKQLGPQNEPFPAIAQAQASIHTDLYNLSKTVIRAPSAGVITNDYLLPGSVVGTNAPLFALVEPNQFWVVGRYKEGALQHIQIGEKVSVYLKMYGWKKFTGTVTNIGYGVNRREASNTVTPSSLPYLEQTEDWIQLQQRFPVEVTLDQAPANMPYRIGASARLFIHRS